MCDASALVQMLLDCGPDGRWATDRLAARTLLAPAVVDFEVANVLRRHESSGQTSADQAAQAHADLRDLAVERWPYEPLAWRVWQLRHNLSSYDASYVALAELLDIPLVTLDRRIARAPGVRCPVQTR